MAVEKPLSDACLRNQDPILEILRIHMKQPGKVIEIGCGTGQHAVYFAANLPHLQWQATDQASWLDGANLWIGPAQLANLPAPICLDVTMSNWPTSPVKYVFSANVLHYMPEAHGVNFFAGIAATLLSSGTLVLYGPFNEQGYTSEGNANLDAWLKRDIHQDSGLWELSDVLNLAHAHGLNLKKEITMPANNRCLVFNKMESA
jgi:cyclopropane fatty-acyl-phospholipid synthase-like methyltransferase